MPKSELSPSRQPSPSPCPQSVPAPASTASPSHFGSAAHSSARLRNRRIVPSSSMDACPSARSKSSFAQLAFPPRVNCISDCARPSKFLIMALSAACLTFAAPQPLFFFRAPVPRSFPTAACFFLAPAISPPIPFHHSTVFTKLRRKRKGQFPWESPLLHSELAYCALRIPAASSPSIELRNGTTPCAPPCPGPHPQVLLHQVHLRRSLCTRKELFQWNPIGKRKPPCSSPRSSASTRRILPDIQAPNRFRLQPPPSHPLRPCAKVNQLTRSLEEFLCLSLHLQIRGSGPNKSGKPRSPSHLALFLIECP